MIAAIPFPKWLKPEIIPMLPFRWYGLMYVVAFAVVYFLFRWQAKNRKLDISSDDTLSFFSWGIIGLLIGARIFGTLVYDRSGVYWRQPWLIFWPFDDRGRFVGLMGMSYHGGLLGLIGGTFLYCKLRKKDFLEWWDLTAAGVPLGYTFGRLGNFINGELFGRVTANPLGMIFPDAGGFAVNDASGQPTEWVRNLAERAGIAISGMASTVNLPRHPSQLYEALFEGLVLWAILWFAIRPRKPFKGFMVGAYLIGYGLARFVIEYFRAPDSDIGYVINLSGKDLSGAEAIARLSTPWAFSMGQLLCFLMMAAGSILLWILWKADKQDKLVASQGGPAKRSAKGLDRKLRKRIR